MLGQKTGHEGRQEKPGNKWHREVRGIERKRITGGGGGGQMCVSMYVARMCE